MARPPVRRGVLLAVSALLLVPAQASALGDCTTYTALPQPPPTAPKDAIAVDRAGRIHLAGSNAKGDRAVVVRYAGGKWKTIVSLKVGKVGTGLQAASLAPDGRTIWFAGVASDREASIFGSVSYGFLLRWDGREAGVLDVPKGYGLEEIADVVARGRDSVDALGIPSSDEELSTGTRGPVLLRFTPGGFKRLPLRHPGQPVWFGERMDARGATTFIAGDGMTPLPGFGNQTPQQVFLWSARGSTGVFRAPFALEEGRYTEDVVALSGTQAIVVGTSIRAGTAARAQRWTGSGWVDEPVPGVSYQGTSAGFASMNAVTRAGDGSVMAIGGTNESGYLSWRRTAAGWERLANVPPLARAMPDDFAISSGTAITTAPDGRVYALHSVSSPAHFHGVPHVLRAC